MFYSYPNIGKDSDAGGGLGAGGEGDARG